MKLLIVDKTTEAQALCAKRIESFSRGDLEMLDLKVKLVSAKDFAERVADVDVIVIGSGLGEGAIAIARQASSLAPWAQLIMFVTESAYGGGAFRMAQSAGVRKVFPDSASPLDFLQELVAINSDLRKEGRTHEGKIVVVVHAKGGVGATSITAAIADVCSEYGRRTMLWDLDVETRDLSRGLNAYGPEEKVVSSWVTGGQEIDRDTLRKALIPIGKDVGLLTTPDRFAEAMDLVCHTDGMAIAQRIAEVSRADNDVVLIDTAGRFGPAIGSLIRIADIVLVVIDDTVLGLTASGALMSVQEMAAELEPTHRLGAAPWRLPAIPKDPKAALWPGRGKTLYSLGNKQLRQVLEQVTRDLGLLGDAPLGVGERGGDDDSDRAKGASAPRWFQRIFSRKQEGVSS